MAASNRPLPHLPGRCRAKIADTLGLCPRPSLFRLMTYFKKSHKYPSVQSKDLEFDGVTVRVYQPKAPCAGPRRGFLFFHGGMGLFGDIAYYEDICSRFCKDSETVVVSVDYRLAPEYGFPTQHNDCLAATVHFMKNTEAYGVDPSRVIVGGDSIGGNIASFVAQKLVERSDLPKLRAQALIYPGLQAMDFSLPSYQQNSMTPLLYKETTIEYGLIYFGKPPSLKEQLMKGSHVPDDFRRKCEKWMSADNIPEKFKRRGYKPVPLVPYKPEIYAQLSEILETTFSSLLAEDSVIQKLPETFILSCELDVLRDDSLLYKKRLEDNGVKVTWFHAKNGFHGVINLVGVRVLNLPVTTEIMDRINDFLKQL
uniref:Alpha/beta hydrolase fold-3 domain-containing protein n=1 Tax=Salvator merianae TaxID=96440 RepID=A0A8D0BYI8_SALMN